MARMMTASTSDSAVPGASRARLTRLAPLLCLLLTCCTVWVKPGATEADLDAARTHCDAASYAVMPSAMVTTYGRGADYSDRKKCEFYNSNGCVRTGDRYTAVTSVTTDANRSGRDAIFRDCMYQGGWRPKE